MFLQIILFSFLLFPNISNASFLEDFGASAKSMGLGGQGNLTSSSACLNYYMPAALANSETLQLEFSSFATRYNIKPITNIVLENSINTESGEEKIGNIDNDFSDLISNAFHASLPLQRIRASLNATVISPFPYVAQFDSGDPYAPEYAFIKSSPRRPQGFFNLAFGIKNNYSFSIGAHLGAKAESYILTKAAVNNQGDSKLYSFAKGGGEVTPKLAPIVSFFFQNEKFQGGLYFQGEMESNLKVDLTADEISTGIIFDSIIESVLFYDPQTIKAQFSFQFNDRFSFISSINYYEWKKYHTPKITISPLAIMEGTFNYEKLSLRNTFSLKLGGIYQLKENIRLAGGIGYDQSPLDSDFSESGNTIHSDIFTVALAPTLDFEFVDFKFNTSLGLSYKQLSNQTVTKLPGQENGQSGRKIGAPGYEIGGKIYTVSLDLGVEI